jgi:hypothetical protein
VPLRLALIVFFVAGALGARGLLAADDVSIAALRGALPRSAHECDESTFRRVDAAAGDLAGRAAMLPEFRDGTPAAELFRRVESLATTQRQIDEIVDQILALRTRFATLPDDPSRRGRIRGFLKTAARMIDLSGRLRHSSVDLFDNVAVAVSAAPRDLRRLIELFQRHKSTVGASVMTPFLNDPPPDNSEGLQPISADLKIAILQLIGQTGYTDALATVARTLRASPSYPEVTLTAAETAGQLGLPQDPLPDQDPTLPKPAITAGELHSIVSRVRLPRRRIDLVRRQRELLLSLDLKRQKGLTEDEYRLGRHVLRPGDWLLMRNPSPYNLFSDLSPGLFTHVGVVTTVTPPDGKRRLVVVDLPERGTRILATNVDLFVQRTLNYVVLRHPDPEVAAKMATTAAAVVGNESQFDLNFRTERVAQLKGRPLAGAKINTYCAGLLLLCAQETGRDTAEFFPIPDRCAGGRTKENLARLGVSIPDGFLSPTGPLFSSQLAIVARREPMHSPGREIEQAVFDHFAASLRERKLTGSWDEFHALRIKLAEAARSNPLLAKALAKAANVNQEMDLVSAAKTAAIVATLDEAAFGASRQFTAAWQAFMRPDADPSAAEAVKKRHDDLWRRRQLGQITTADLRRDLVGFYTNVGRSDVDQRLFLTEKRPD